jgi:hypothetical protein
MDVIHNPFTNGFVAADHGAPIRIIAGSGAGRRNGRLRKLPEQ